MPTAAAPHDRCRWLRGLMLRNGLVHSWLRRASPGRLGALIAHLPANWSRLEYLLQSNQEGCMPLPAVMDSSEGAFAATFPEYRQWQSYCSQQQVGRV
jgi:hypothetical protein